MAKFVVKSDKLSHWQKVLLEGYSMGEVKPMKVSHRGEHKGKPPKRGSIKDISVEDNSKFEAEWEEAKKLILAERSKWDF